MSDANMICVWGSPSSGKTTIAAKLAAEYAKGENVILLLADPLVSGISQLLPEKENQKDMNKAKSLGHLLANNTISEKAILRELIADRENLALLGYRYAETAASYPEYFQTHVSDFLLKLRTVVDKVVIDCSGNILSDLLSTVALKMSDINVYVSEALPKGMIYYDALLPLLADPSYGISEQIKVLNKIKSYQDIALLEEKYKDIDIYIPYEEDVEIMAAEKRILLSESRIDSYVRELYEKIKGEEPELKQKKRFPALLKRNHKKSDEYQKERTTNDGSQ